MDPSQVAARLKALVASFTIPQLISLAAAFLLAVTVIGGSAWYMNRPDYALLFGDMDAETAGEIVSRLKTLKVDYQLDAGGRAVRVPANKVDELRLELTAQGLPTSGRVGFEIFDRTTFGATEFLEQVNYRRALEGEIARTIATISEVANARVHIAMGKDSLFGESRPAKASVVLKLRGRQTLSASAINGIGNLVAASVEGLRPDAVVILDSFGRPLARPLDDGTDPLGAAASERQQRIEKEMAQRVVAMLEPVVGPDRVRVNITARLNPETREETEERWDPNTVLRSRQTQADIAGAAANAAGLPVAGARGNAPPPLVDPRALPGQNATPPIQTQQLLAPSGPSRTAETASYEVSRTTRHTVQPPGDIARLSVAVILDDDQVVKKSSDGKAQVSRKPRTREELQKIQGLVAAAVGLDPQRGDQLTVENVSFEEPPIDDEPSQNILQKLTPQLWEGTRFIVTGAMGLLALLLFVRPLMKRAGVEPADVLSAAKVIAAPPALPPTPAVKTVADLENEIEAQLEATIQPTAESRRLPVLARRVSQVSTKDPENIAKLIRGWMQEAER